MAAPSSSTPTGAAPTSSGSSSGSPDTTDRRGRPFPPRPARAADPGPQQRTAHPLLFDHSEGPNMFTKARWLVAAAITAAMAATGVATIGDVAMAESNGGVRVMPLGDSITEGTQVPGGYRTGLWQRMAGGGYRVDLVGSQFNGPSSLGDHDHEGHPGWRIDQIDANITGWLQATSAHTVLLHIGTNDVLQNYQLSTAPARLSGLLDRITAAA